MRENYQIIHSEFWYKNFMKIIIGKSFTKKEIDKAKKNNGYIGTIQGVDYYLERKFNEV